MPTAADFKMELHRILLEAVRQGKQTAEVNAGDLHTRVGGYPGANHRMPVCCEVMRSAIATDIGDVVLSEPPSGQGATLTVRYVIPRPVDISAGINALKAVTSEPVKFPTLVRYTFSCKKCRKQFPIESGVSVRNAMSLEEAYENLAAFAKTVEPRIIKCSCGHEDQYYQKDVGFVALE